MNRTLLLVALLSLPVPIVASGHPSAEHQIELLSERIRAQPDDQANYIRRGQAYSNDGQLERALVDLRKAEQLGDPLHVAFDLGVLHYRMGKLDAARRYFDAFLERHPGHPRALEYRARVSRDAGDHAAALADFRAYFARIERPNPGDYVSAARMLASLDGQGVAAALSMLDQGIDKLGTIPQLQRYAIELERSRGNTSGAIARLESLEPSLGKSPDWKIDMGELLLLAGRPVEARQHFDAAATQLGRMPTTPARAELRQRLQALSARMNAGGNSPRGESDSGEAMR